MWESGTSRGHLHLVRQWVAHVELRHMPNTSAPCRATSSTAPAGSVYWQDPIQLLTRQAIPCRLGFAARQRHLTSNNGRQDVFLEHLQLSILLAESCVIV